VHVLLILFVLFLCCAAFRSMIGWLVLLVLLAALLGHARAALAQTLTCETSGAYRHCFDHRGYESTEERRGDYVHGWDSNGRRWTTWEHDGRTVTWPTR
jgi:hypothetical protein